MHTCKSFHPLIFCPGPTKRSWAKDGGFCLFVFSYFIPDQPLSLWSSWYYIHLSLSELLFLLALKPLPLRKFFPIRWKLSSISPTRTKTIKHTRALFFHSCLWLPPFLSFLDIIAEIKKGSTLSVSAPSPHIPSSPLSSPFPTFAKSVGPSLSYLGGPTHVI